MDINDLLAGVPREDVGGGSDAPVGANPKKSKSGSRERRQKPKGMSREVFSLLSANQVAASNLGAAAETSPSNYEDAASGAIIDPSGELVVGPPLVPSYSFKPGRTLVIDPSRAARKWKWSSFLNSARLGENPVKHWQVDGIDPADYSFAKFNKMCFTATYSGSDVDYDALGLFSEDWTKEDTDHLLDLAQKFDLRWPVISDRWSRSPRRPVVDLQSRYYAIAKKILAAPAPVVPQSDPAPRRSSKVSMNDCILAGRISSRAVAQSRVQLLDFEFNEEFERRRTAQLQKLYARSASEEREEMKILAEIRQIEEQLGKVVDPKGHNNSVRLQSTLLEKAAKLGTASFDVSVSIARELTVGTSLRSARLNMNISSVGLGAKMMKKMTLMLAELDVPLRPLPTAAVCDAYDELRKDAVKLLILQKQLRKLTQADAGANKQSLPAPPALAPTVVESASSSNPQAQTSPGEPSLEPNSFGQPQQEQTDEDKSRIREESARKKSRTR